MSFLKWVSQHFGELQIAIIVFAFGSALAFQKNRSKSKFKVREADRPDLQNLFQKEAVKKSKTPPPLKLPGLRLTGEPFEILGVSENATEAEIQKAFKEALLRYHPDRIQGQAQEQIQFYQDATAKIIAAKEEMIARLKRPK